MAWVSQECWRHSRSCGERRLEYWLNPDIPTPLRRERTVVYIVGESAPSSRRGWEAVLGGRLPGSLIVLLSLFIPNKVYQDTSASI